MERSCLFCGFPLYNVIDSVSTTKSAAHKQINEAPSDDIASLLGSSISGDGRFSLCAIPFSAFSF